MLRPLPKSATSTIAKTSLELEQYAQTRYREVREVIRNSETNRKDMLRYFNTFSYEPEDFHARKSTGVFDQESWELSQRQALEADIPALASRTAYQPFDLRDYSKEQAKSPECDTVSQRHGGTDVTPAIRAQPTLYSKALKKLIDADDPGKIRSVLLMLPDFENKILQNSMPKASDRSLATDSGETLQPTEKALIDYVEWKTGLKIAELIDPTSATESSQRNSGTPSSKLSGDPIRRDVNMGKSNLDQTSPPASAKLFSSQEEQLKFLLDLLAAWETRLDRLCDLMTRFNLQLSLKTLPKMGQIDNLLGLCNTLKNRVAFCRNGLLLELDEKLKSKKPPSDSDELIDFGDSGEFPPSLHPSVILDIAIGIICDKIPKASVEGNAQTVSLSSDELLVYFEWKAGLSLKEMLEAFLCLSQRLLPPEATTGFVFTKDCPIVLVKID